MARLGDICEILNGYAFKSENYTNNGVRIIRISNVQKGYVEDNTPEFYPFDDINVEKYALFEGDLLLSLTGNVGRVGLLDKKFLPAALNQRVACIRIKDNGILDKLFLFNFLNSNNFEQKCVQYSKGVAQKNMSTEWLKNFEISLPPLAEQRKIAAVLDKVSDLIAKRRQQLTKLDELVKARFVEMFGILEFNNNATTIEEISEMVTVGIANSATHAYAAEGIVLLRNQNIRENYLDDSDLVYITPTFADKYRTKALKENDILVTRTGYPGIACLVPNKYIGCQTFTTLILRLKESIAILPLFVCHYINSNYGKRFVDEMKVGVAQQNFGAKALEKMPIFVPPMEKQVEFVAFIGEIEKIKASISHSLEQMEMLKMSLMQKYFGG